MKVKTVCTIHTNKLEHTDELELSSVRIHITKKKKNIYYQNWDRKSKWANNLERYKKVL